MKTNKIIYGALLIAIRVILTRFFSIQLPTLRIGFGFVPAMMTGMFFSPLVSGFIGVIADVVGFSLFPKGDYFIGYTISAFLGGVINSYFFYQKDITLKNVIIAVVLNAVVINMVLNTLWISMTMGKAFMVLLPTRAIKNLIMIPIHIGVFVSVVYPLKKSSHFRAIMREV